MEEKICPLKFNSVTLNEGGMLFGPCRCEAEKCKWWYAEAKACCLHYLPLVALNIGTLDIAIRQSHK
ncbi:hypothetical protein MUP77_24140 [Candidatus Bathyarchaeota archaeon]|nr:hypothetical protein [Candidatus Bathyarchaeota archaeon]